MIAESTTKSSQAASRILSSIVNRCLIERKSSGGDGDHAHGCSGGGLVIVKGDERIYMTQQPKPAEPKVSYVSESLMERRWG